MAEVRLPRSNQLLMQLGFLSGFLIMFTQIARMDFGIGDMFDQANENREQAQNPLLPSASSKEEEAISILLGLAKSSSAATDSTLQPSTSMVSEKELNLLLKMFDIGAFQIAPFDPNTGGCSRMRQPVGCGGQDRQNKQNMCSYSCIKEGCHQYAFFCENLDCDCKQKHLKHLYEKGSWISMEQLIKELQQRPTLLKNSQLDKWLLMDDCIDRMVERLHQLKRAHAEQKKAFLKRKLPYLYMRELIRNRQFSTTNPHFTGDRIRKTLRECLSQQELRPMYSAGKMSNNTYYEPNKHQLETVELRKHEAAIDQLCNDIEDTWQFKAPLSVELMDPLTQLKELKELPDWAEAIQFPEWYKEDDEWQRILSVLSKNPNRNRLNSLEFKQTGQSGAGDSVVALFVPEMKYIEELRIWNATKANKLTAVGAQTISVLNDIRKLEVGGNNIGDEGMKWICGMANLYRLGISSNNIRDEGACQLSRLKCLAHLTASFNQFSWRGCEAIGSITTLKSLNIAMVHVTDRGLQAICRCRKLTQLYISNTHITDEGLQHIKHLRNLVILSADHNDLRRMPSIGELTQLEQLYINSNNDLLEQAVAEISKVVSLAHLGVMACGITNKSAMCLMKLKKLVELCANHNRFDDDAVSYISKLENLQHLELSGNDITRKGVLQLRTCSKLKQIYLSGCRVNHADRSELKKYLPQATIYINHY